MVEEAVEEDDEEDEEVYSSLSLSHRFEVSSWMFLSLGSC